MRTWKLLPVAGAFVLASVVPAPMGAAAHPVEHRGSPTVDADPVEHRGSPTVDADPVERRGSPTVDAASSHRAGCITSVHDGFPYLEPNGTLRGAMLFVDYPDAPGHTSTVDIYDALAPAAEDWFAENSYGELTLEITPVHGWLRMSQESSYYGLTGDHEAPKWWEHGQEALDLASGLYDFTDVDILYPVSAEGANHTMTWANMAWPEGGLTVDGHEIRFLSALDVEIYSDMSWAPYLITHETGHFLGEPDLYDGTGSQVFAGAWDMMDSMYEGRHFSGWTKARLGWVDGARTRCLSGTANETFTLSPTTQGDGLTVAILPTGQHTGYVLEARHPEGFDGSACYGGLLISKVDDEIPSTEGSVRVQPAGADLLDPWECGDLNGAPYLVGGVFEPSDLDVRIEVTGIAPSGAVTVNVSPTALPDLRVVQLVDPPDTAVAGTSLSVTDRTRNVGDAVAGASRTGYYLTHQKNFDAPSRRLTGVRLIGELAPGAFDHGTRTVTVPDDVPPRSYWLAACADDTDLVVEWDETNNCRWSTTQITIGAPPDLPTFSDVSDTSPHREAISKLAAAGVTLGCGGDRFCPGEPVTRAQMATFLMKALELTPGSASPPFTDVRAGSLHARAIDALRREGVTSGCGGGRYCPNDDVRRDQMASFLTRAIPLELGVPNPPFTDVVPGSTHARAIDAVRREGITRGCGDGVYCPERSVTRAQMASFLVAALGW